MGLRETGLLGDAYGSGYITYYLKHAQTIADVLNDKRFIMLFYWRLKPMRLLDTLIPNIKASLLRSSQVFIDFHTPLQIIL